mgnify:CR=1 FL=1
MIFFSNDIKSKIFIFVRKVYIDAIYNLYETSITNMIGISALIYSYKVLMQRYDLSSIDKFTHVP